jgi:phage shock protein A
MSGSPEEMRIRDVAIGSQAEIVEANYHREKVELKNSELRNEIQDLNNRIHIEQVAQEASQKASRQVTERLLRIIAARDSEITAIRQSHTWKIGSLVLAPLRWIKRSKR